MDWKLELIVVPATDVDRAKEFYVEKAGFEVLVDVSPGDKFRVVQLNPPGSACAIAIMHVPERAGKVQGLHLVVQDIEAARTELLGRGMRPSEPFHFAGGVQTDGLHPERSDYQSFFSFEDPDGNVWLVQEVKR
jgi:catechol 2,3-dioxygenase-like lactoylglutathione lyase family enzyme